MYNVLLGVGTFIFSLDTKGGILFSHIIPKIFYSIFHKLNKNIVGVCLCEKSYKTYKMCISPPGNLTFSCLFILIENANDIGKLCTML